MSHNTNIGIGAMVTGGALQFLALFFIALAEDSILQGLILAAVGLALFAGGAVLYDTRSERSLQSPRPPTYIDEA